MKTLVVGGSGFIGSYLMKEIEAVNIDLKNGIDVRDGIKNQYQQIIFLACNQANTLEAYEENWQMFEALNDYRKTNPATRLIYISSAAIYTPNSFYALSKLLGEAYAKRFATYSILRLSNVFGHGDGHGAPDRFMRGETDIYGNGEQVRDLIPVEQVVTAILKLNFGTLNVSSGRGTTVNEMFKIWGKGKPEHVKKDRGVFSSILTPGAVND